MIIFHKRNRIFFERHWLNILRINHFERILSSAYIPTMRIQSISIANLKDKNKNSRKTRSGDRGEKKKRNWKELSRQPYNILSSNISPSPISNYISRSFSTYFTTQTKLSVRFGAIDGSSNNLVISKERPVW